MRITPNFPEIDLQDLGAGGLIINGRLRDGLGSAVEFGDITGDGIDDLIIGKSSPKSGRGSLVFVVEGSIDLPETLPFDQPTGGAMTISVTVSTGEPITQTFVSFLGDMNGDGIGDLGISRWVAPGAIVFGGTHLENDMDLDELIDSGKAVRIIPASEESWDYQIVPVGDLDGDGIPDLAVGSGQRPLRQNSSQGPGEVVFIRGRTTWPREVKLNDPASVISRIIGSRRDQGFAATLRAVGDVNGDGFTDLLATAQESEDLANEPYVYLVFGSDHLPAFEDVESLIRDGGGVAILPPMTILSYLFLSGEHPPCVDALDADDSGLLDINDPAYLLGFLFLAEPPPPQPFPDPGKDTTTDVLDCRGFNP